MDQGKHTKKQEEKETINHDSCTLWNNTKEY